MAIHINICATMSATKNLSNQLLDLINPEPTFEDPEDDENLDTAIKWIQRPESEGDKPLDIPSSSTLRKKQVSFLSAVSKR